MGQRAIERMRFGQNVLWREKVVEQEVRYIDRYIYHEERKCLTRDHHQTLVVVVVGGLQKSVRKTETSFLSPLRQESE